MGICDAVAEREGWVQNNSDWKLDGVSDDDIPIP